MEYYPASLRRLIRLMARLPGIGEKTAERLALYLLSAGTAQVEDLARGIVEVKQKVRLCSRCFSLSDDELCAVCSNPARDAALVCVVEQPGDMVALEKSGGYAGLYHVLSGVLSPLNGVGPDEIRVRELIERIAAGGVREVVLATGTSVEGEATAVYLAGRLQEFPVAVTRIAAGVPMGGDLKYVDQVTLKRAMESRRALG
ncbi:MAG TPA: recombination mediator RecR [Desulfobacterales bacterium]|jgi:recombination protein RecR|nr:recombination mediator RecR [Desulfobacterales bacterium]